MNKCFLFFLILLNFNLAAQPPSKFRDFASYSLAAGSSSYFGDLSPYRTFYRGFLKSSSFNFGASYTKEINEHWANYLEFHLTELRGSDFKYNYKSNEILNSYLLRNFHFRNHLISLAFLKKYYPFENNATINRRRPIFQPYLSAGIGVFFHNPQARGVYADGKANWVALQPLHTAGNQYTYSRFQPYVPLSIGFIKKLNRRCDFKAQATLNLCFTDYLDDVSQTPYISSSSFSNPEAYIFHNRASEEFDALTGKSRTDYLECLGIQNQEIAGGFRGSNTSILSRFDLYITTEIGLNIWLEKKIR